MIKGIVPDFGYDVKLAVVVDNEKQDNIPERGLYKTNVSCNNNATGEWDYNAWNLKLENVSEGTKCNLEFTSNLTEEEYKNYLEAGIILRRNTYRGKDITSLYTNGDLYKQISNCTFDDIYVGDYIKTNTNDKEVTWLIADLNNYLNSGSDVDNKRITKCHATIIPDVPLKDAQMNPTDTAEGAYVNSEMYKTTLNSIYAEYIEPNFKNHIITYQNLLSDKIDDNINNPNLGTGASSQWTRYDRQLDLMSEVNVLGAVVISSSSRDIGFDYQQYAIFRLKPEYIFSNKKGKTFSYWLKAVTGFNSFAYIQSDGYVTSSASSNSIGVRPRFLID